MKADKDAVWEGLKAEFEQMNAAPFAYTGLTYDQAGLEDSYTDDTSAASAEDTDFRGEDREEG